MKAELRKEEPAAGGARHSIRRRILLVSLFASLAVAAIFMLAANALSERSFRDGIRKKTEATASRLAVSLTIPLWAYISEACEEIVKGELADADFLAIYLRDTTALIIALERGESATGGTVTHVGPEDEKRIAGVALARSSRKIVKDGMLIGEVTLYASGFLGRADSRLILLQQTLMALLEGVFIALLVFLMVDRFISRRVIAMGREFGEFSERNLSVRARDSRPDEIGDLARSFNKMAGLIQGYAMELETTVAERTGELKKSNEELVAANERLSRALEELTATQDTLVETRKAAVIGQIVAGIAHQLNTPLGAIGSANRMIMDEIRDRISLISRELAGIDEADAAILEELLAESYASDVTIDFALLRRRRRELLATLQAAGFDDPTNLADSIIEANVFGLGTRLMEFIGTKRFVSLLSIVESISVIRKSGLIIATASDKAANVIKALRVYLGQSPGEEIETLALATELEAVLALFRHVTRGGLELQTTFDRKLLVRGRHEQLDLVWMNLIDNAIQAMSGKGRLEVRLEAVNGEARIGVVDDGPGIAPEHQAQIFDPFFTTKPRGGGLGLGLNSAKKIVEDHGGRIGFESRPGRTEFVVYLPTQARRPE